MPEYYARKIRNGVINKKTKAAWTVDDVPERWRAEVKKEFEREK